MPEVRYVPTDQDRPWTKVGNVRFRANEWTPICDAEWRKDGYNPDHFVEQVIGTEGETPDGLRIIRHQHKMVRIDKVIENNPFFEVKGGKTAEQKKRGRPRNPETAEEYKVYALTWIGTGTDAREMRARWVREHQLRERVGAADAIAEEIFAQFSLKVEALEMMQK